MPQQFEQEMTITHKKNKTLLLENKMLLTCLMEVKSICPNITYPAMMEEYDNIIDIEKVNKSIYRENKDSIHINVNENVTETTRDILEEVID